MNPTALLPTIGYWSWAGLWNGTFGSDHTARAHSVKSGCLQLYSGKSVPQSSCGPGGLHKASEARLLPASRA
jgi:hypothetical protein